MDRHDVRPDQAPPHEDHDRRRGAEGLAEHHGGEPAAPADDVIAGSATSGATAVAAVRP